MIAARELTCHKPAQRRTYGGTAINEVCYFSGHWRSPGSIDKQRGYLRIRQAARAHIANAHPAELAIEKAKQMEEEVAGSHNSHGRARGRAVIVLAKRYPKELLFWMEVERANLDDT